MLYEVITSGRSAQVGVPPDPSASVSARTSASGAAQAPDLGELGGGGLELGQALSQRISYNFV